MAKKVLLIHPPSPFLWDERTVCPLGAITVATVMNQTGFETEVLDLAGVKGWEKTAMDRIPGYDAVGFSTTTQQTSRVSVLLARINQEFPGMHTVAGGAGPTTDPLRYVGMGCSKVVKNEGEYAFSAWEPEGPQVVTMPLPDNLNRLPFADRDLVDIKSYTFQVWDTDGTPMPSTHIMSTRGCPMACSFCSGRELDYYRRYRAFSPKRIVAELEFIRNKWGFNAFTDYSDEINIDKKWLLEYCSLMKGRGFKMRSFCVAKLLTEELAKAMKDAGWVQICFGAESGSDEILKLSTINKTTVADTIRATHTAQKHGLRVKLFIQVGLPGETRETALMTKRMLLEAHPDDFDCTISTPFPGSPHFEHPEKWADSFQFQKIDFSNEELGFYKASPGEYRAYSRTPALSSEDLVALRDEIDNAVRDALGIPRVTKVDYQTAIEHSMGQGQGV